MLVIYLSYYLIPDPTRIGKYCSLLYASMDSHEEIATAIIKTVTSTITISSFRSCFILQFLVLFFLAWLVCLACYQTHYVLGYSSIDTVVYCLLFFLLSLFYNLYFFFLFYSSVLYSDCKSFNFFYPNTYVHNQECFL